jgi:hypothetical protein
VAEASTLRRPAAAAATPRAAADPARTRRLFALATFALVFLGYALSLAPTVTFWDAGEFIATAHILGIPHPPGTPLFVLLGRVTSLLPLGLPVALKLNALSALASALGSLFFCLAVSRVLETWLGNRNPAASPVPAQLGAMAAVLTAAFGLTVWESSNETEVYALAMLTIGIVSWLLPTWRERRLRVGSDHLLLFGAFLMGLSVGTHLMGVLSLPAAGIFVAMVLWNERRAFLFAVAAGLAAMYLIVLKGFDADAWIAGEGSVLVPAALVPGLLLLAVSLFFLARQRALGFFGLALLFFALGTSVNLYLKIRAGLHPVINEADPSTWKSLVEVLLRRQYDVRPVFPRTVDFLHYQIPMYFDYLFGRVGPFRSDVSSQFAGPAPVGGIVTIAYVALALWGAVQHARTDRPSFVYFLLLWATTSLGLILWLNFKAGFSQGLDVADLPREVRERDYFFLVSFYVVGLWAGIGAFTLLAGAIRGRLGRAAEAARGRRDWALGAAALCFALPVATYALNNREADLSGNTIARDFAYNVLQSAKPFGILFTNGDNDTFPLWYLQEVEGVRRDVVVANLSLLNTTWYLEQLEKSPFSATPPAAPVVTATGDTLATGDFPKGPVLQQAHDLPPYVPLRDPVELSIQAAGSGRDLKLALPAGYLRRQDLAVLKVLGQQLDQRPVYFSVTVPTDGLVETQPYLTRVGILYEVNSRPSTEAAAADSSLFEAPGRAGLVFDVPRSDDLLWNVYRYRGLQDPGIYKDATTRALIKNYGYTLLGMSEVYYFKDEPQKALRAQNLAQSFLGTPPTGGTYANALKLMAAAGDTVAVDSLLAVPDVKALITRPALESAALLAALKGQYRSAHRLMERQVPLLTREQPAKEVLVRLGDVALENGDSAAAEDFYAVSLRGDRDFRLGYLKLVSTAGERGQLPTAIGVVENWVLNHPADSLSKRLLDEMKATQRFPDELRWKNLARYFPEDTLHQPALPESAAQAN